MNQFARRRGSSLSLARTSASFAALGLLLVIGVIGCDRRQQADSLANKARTYSSFDRPVSSGKVLPAKSIKLEQADLTQVLSLYADISGRSIIRAADLNETKISFSNETPLSSVEALQALDSVLAANGITTVLISSQYVKIVATKNATSEAPPIIDLPADQLPDSSSFMMRIVKLEHLTSTEAMGMVSPFAGMPNSIIAVRSAGSRKAPSKSSLPDIQELFAAKDNIIILRDYSSHVRRMLQVIEKYEKR